MEKRVIAIPPFIQDTWVLDFCDQITPFFRIFSEGGRTNTPVWVMDSEPSKICWHEPDIDWQGWTMGYVLGCSEPKSTWCGQWAPNSYCITIRTYQDSYHREHIRYDLSVHEGAAKLALSMGYISIENGQPKQEYQKVYRFDSKGSHKLSFDYC